MCEDILSLELYSMYNTKDAIVSAIHPLRLVLKELGYSEKEVEKLFPYSSSMHAKMSSKSSSQYVPVCPRQSSVLYTRRYV